MSNIYIEELAEKIINGYRIKRGDDFSSFLSVQLDELQKGAYALQRHFRGNRIELCSIINGRSGRCSEDCKYCAQAACHAAGITEYSCLPTEEIINSAQNNENAGIDRFSVVTSGRTLNDKDFAYMLNIYSELLKSVHIGICASHGFLTSEQLEQLRAAGVTNYHHNIETSRRFFPNICTTHTYDDKLHMIKLAQKAGFCVCSGVIIGMGETWEDRFDMAVSLAELGIMSIPINILIAVKGTQLEHLPSMEIEDILRTIAVFRFINPEADIRLAAGRKLLPNAGESAFRGGASASITGNMLTTSGTTIYDDVKLREELENTAKQSAF